MLHLTLPQQGFTGQVVAQHKFSSTRTTLGIRSVVRRFENLFVSNARARKRRCCHESLIVLSPAGERLLLQEEPMHLCSSVCLRNMISHATLHRWGPVRQRVFALAPSLPFRARLDRLLRVFPAVGVGGISFPSRLRDGKSPRPARVRQLSVIAVAMPISHNAKQLPRVLAAGWR